MHHPSLEDLLSAVQTKTRKSQPVAFLFCEDRKLVNETLEHLIQTGFSTIAVIDSTVPGIDPVDSDIVEAANVQFRSRADVARILNLAIEKLESRWIFFCYNSEFIYFPFSEKRNIADATLFLTEERRHSTHCVVVDLYSDDLQRDTSGISVENAHFDSFGYFATQRYDDTEPLERQSDVFGGLKWRFEDHIPWEQRRIDRICLFRADPKVLLDDDLLFSEPEWNTVSCTWHNNLTIAVASFRTAKALMHNPGSRSSINTFRAPQSVPFNWSSQQLMELGFMEPGQWF